MNKQVKYYLILIVILLISNLKAQFTFNNYYSSGKLSGANHVQVLPNNSYLCTGYFKDSLTSQQGIEFRKLDQTGSTIIRKRYQVGTEDFATYLNNKYVIEHSNTRFFVSGATYTGTLMTVLFVAVNPLTLDTIFCKKYIDGNEFYFAHTFKINQNEIWLVGNKFNSVTSLPNRPVIFKYDTLGNLLSIKEFTNYTNYDCLAIDYDAANGRLYFAGNNFNVNPMGYNISCIDTSGVIIWNKNITNDDYYYRSIKVIDGELICAGNKITKYVSVHPFHKLTIVKYNVINGNLIDNRLYGISFKNNTFTSICKLPSNQLILSGKYNYNENSNTLKHGGFILKINNNLDSVWMRLYTNFPDIIEETFFDIKQTADNGFIACGAPIYAPTPQSQSWVVKTDSLGIAPGAITVNLNEQKLNEFNTSVYPNPFKTSIQVNTNTSLKLNLRVIDVLGKLQYAQNLSQATTKIDLYFLPSGIYFISFLNEQGQSKTIKLIKQ